MQSIPMPPKAASVTPKAVSSGSDGKKRPLTPAAGALPVTPLKKPKASELECEHCEKPIPNELAEDVISYVDNNRHRVFCSNTCHKKAKASQALESEKATKEKPRRSPRRKKRVRK